MITQKTMLPFSLPLFSLLLCLAAGAQPSEHTIAWYEAHCPFPMPEVIRPSFPDRNFRIVDYGAIGDGKTLNTAAFQKAIGACSAAGGGRVVIPSGKWLTGPIELSSHVDLHLEAGAKVLFTPDHSWYFTGQRLVFPISGRDLEDIAITGLGYFDGAGDSWRPVKKSKQTEAQWRSLLASGGTLSPDGDIWWPGRETAGSPRPNMVSIVNCRRVLIQGVTIRNSPKFAFCPNNCTDLTMDSATIYNDWWAQNGDGIDISACKKVVIYKCTVNAGDDGICMKSSGARPDGPALENVLIAGCTVGRAHGGFVIGSNTDGGMANIFVSDCLFSGTDVGLRFKSNKGRGGLVKDIFIQDISMRDIVREAVLFDTYYEDMPAGAIKDPNKPAPKDKIPEFRDFHISRISCAGAKTAIAITGLHELPVNNIFFDSVTIRAGKGLVATQAKNIDLRNVKLDVSEKPVFQTDKTAEIRVH
ncbi:MAG TPA: glycoside hydrolase family 28 protein [Puia sp.]|jgi:polygalacturonase